MLQVLFHLDRPLQLKRVDRISPVEAFEIRIDAQDCPGIGASTRTFRRTDLGRHSERPDAVSAVTIDSTAARAKELVFGYSWQRVVCSGR
jgi:hypothetical protein